MLVSSHAWPETAPQTADGRSNRDGAWIAVVVENLMAAYPTVTLAEIEATFRDAAAHSYVIDGAGV
jgi:hypothetical protein